MNIFIWKVSNYMYLSIYFVLVYLLFNTSDFIVLWVIMETMTFMFLGFMYNAVSSSFMSMSFMSYYVLQSLASLYILGFWMLDLSSGNFVCLIELFVLLKLAIFPFFYWYYIILFNMSLEILFMVLLPQKLPVLMLNLSVSSSSLIDSSLNYLVLLLSLLMTCFGALMVLDLKSLLIWSSLSNTSWMYFISFISYKVTILYFWVYFSVLLMFMVLISSNLTSSSLTLLLVLLLSMIGFPPFPLFFAKLYAVYYLLAISLFVSSYSSWFLFMILLSSVIMIILYLRQFITYVLPKVTFNS